MGNGKHDASEMDNRMFNAMRVVVRFIKSSNNLS